MGVGLHAYSERDDMGVGPENKVAMRRKRAGAA
jgi:hypothetical protein